MAGGHGALAFLALCKVGFSVSALCALQCAKNGWGSVGEVLGNVKLEHCDQ